MFNKDFFVLFLFIFFIYCLGDLTLSLLAGQFRKKINLFLRLAYSWAIGNSIFVFILSLLFFSNRFNLLQLKNFIISFFLLLFLRIIIFVKNKSDVNANWADWFYLFFILLFFIPLIINSLTSFLIGWDAVAIWFFKAKAIFFHQFDLYIKSGDYLFSSKSYPIGIPLLIASYSRLIDFFNDQIIQFYFLLYYLNLIFLSFGLLLYLFKDKIQRFLLLLTALSFYLATNFIVYSHNGYVDLILGFVMAVIFSLLYLLFEETKFEKRKLLSLIIINSGFALMIKNEAVPFIVFLWLALIIFNLFKKIKIDRYQALVQFIIFLISFLPFVFWQRYIRLNHISSFLDGYYFDFLNLENLKRIKLILNYVIIEILNTNKYNLSLISLILLFIYSFFWLIFNHRLKLVFILLMVVFFGQWLSYVYIYVITPLPFIIQLETSLERLFLQTLPLFFILTSIVIKGILFEKEVK